MNDIIIDFIAQGKFLEARSRITKMNVVDIAQLLEEMDEDSVLVVFRLLPKDMAVDVFSYMSYEQQQFIIESITDKEIKNIINKLFLDDTIELLEEMPANIVKKVLQNTSEARRKVINQLLRYPENSAGSIMTIEFVDLKKEMTILKALDHIKKTGIDKETIDICYVIDSNRKLEGSIPIRKLLLNSEEVIIGDIMDTSIKSVNTHDDQEEIATLFKKYDLVAMPVVDNENRLVGIITIDDVVDIIEREATEDFQKMAAMAPSEEEYLKTNVFVLARHRIPWLLVLMISATFTGGIIMKYQNLLESVAVLSSFIPMLMDTGGNAGSQSSTLIIRGLALGEIKLNDILKILWRELWIAIIVGVALALVNFVRVYFFVNADLIISFTVSVSLIFTVVLAKVVGGILPIIAKKINMDPAIMAGPLITTIVDAMALMAYFFVANRLLGLQ